MKLSAKKHQLKMLNQRKKSPMLPGDFELSEFFFQTDQLGLNTTPLALYPPTLTVYTILVL